MPQVHELRYAQASAALNRAVALKPDLAQAHLSLARLYGGSGCLDLALDHARSHLRLFRAAGPPRGVGADEFREQEAALQDEVERLAREVEARRQVLAAAAGGAGTLERALAASQKGLKARALELLKESDVSNFGSPGMELELELLLTAGRPEDVRDWTSAEHKEALGPASYHWLRVRARAACGDYEAAEEECSAMLPPASGTADDPGPLRRRVALWVGQAMLDEAPGGGAWPSAIRRFVGRPIFREQVFDLAGSLRQEADVRVVRGLLALEEGRTAEAESDFRLALGTWKDRETVASGGGLDFGGRPIAQDCLEWLGYSSRGAVTPRRPEGGR
jgi:tetratricopeptide (TPR) repeat protein